MKHLQLAFALPLVTLFASGCQRGDGLVPAVFASGVVAAAMVASSQDQLERERAEREAYEGSDGPSYRPIIVVTRAARPAAAVPEPSASPPPAFDAGRARDVLAGMDLATCRERGAPRGYGHAKVTFNPSGEISRVVIDEPSGMPVVAAECVGNALGAATVPVFSGSLVTVGTTWFVP